MDAYHLSAPHLEPIRQKQLTKLYSDTKKSALTSINLYSSAGAQFPDLQRRYRIQKDRLITWGLAWSDDEKADDGNIDDAVARAGMTETVDSVLRNIKSVTEEAERIQQASLPRGFGLGGDKSSKPATFDQGRYESLLEDLTTSIDTLYDLSRSRRALARGEHPSFKSTSTEASAGGEKAGSIRKELSRRPSFAASEITLVNPPSFARPSLSPYAGLPPCIELSALRLPEEGPPPYESIGVPSTTRLVGRLIRSKTSDSVRNRIASPAPEVPVLVEYANFDSAYQQTHVPPPLQRLEALAAYLQPMRAESQHNLSLLGYFEDPTQPRMGLVYDLPYAVQNRMYAAGDRKAPSLSPVSLLKLVQRASKTQTVGDTVSPTLEDRFHLALRLVEQLHTLHSYGLPHGNVNSGAVAFTTMSDEPPLRRIRSPLWASFDLFSKCNVEGVRRTVNLNIYRHPADAPQRPGRTFDDDLQFDMYSLALVLLEIGLWTPLGDLYKAKYSLGDFKLRLEKLWIPKLAHKCGTAYMNAVQACFNVVDTPGGQRLTTEGVYGPVIAKLRRCCLLDDTDFAADLTPGAESFAASASSLYGRKVARKPLPTSHSFSGAALSKQHSEPSRPPTTPSVMAASPNIAPPRQGSMPNLVNAAARSPRTPELSRMSSMRSTSRRSSISRVSERRTSSKPSFKEYKRKVTLIQQTWRQWRANRQQRSPKIEALPVHGLDSIDEHGVTKATRSGRCSFPLMPVPQAVIDYWEKDAAIRLAKLCDRALRGSKESSSVELTMYGETPETAKPTCLITCKSTAKMKQMLKSHFKHDPSFCCVRVKKTVEEIRLCRRSRRHGDSAARRTMALTDDVDKAANPDYQERPLCGASIGAFRDDEHLPPVSFGGVVLVDDNAYGMSVHHMLEPPDDDEEEDAEAGADDDGSDTSSIGSASDAVSLYSHSDDESTVRPVSRASSEGDGAPKEHDGDLPGITPDDYEEIDITQPALDDAIDCDLHVDVEEETDDDSGIDEDHLMSYKLGQIFASSGLKRTAASGQDGFRSISQSLPQEIDWALFELVPPRVHPFNIVRGGTKYCAVTATPSGDTLPVAIRTSSQLACAQVHCLGRTSGLGAGVVSSTMELVKIHGRTTFSASWTVDGTFGAGGDSGAWVVSNDDGKVCGHVLASKTGRTYICPMDILLEDMRRTLKARSVALPTAEKGVKKSGSGRDTPASTRAINDAVSQLRLDEPGGVPLPKRPPRRSAGRHTGPFGRSAGAEAVETAG